MARKPGSHTVQPGNFRVRSRAWQAMRSLRVFDLGQLMSVAEIERWNAAKFVRALSRTGYLREVAPANPARRVSATFRLVRDSGPRAPVVRQIGEVFDPNTGAVHRAAVLS